MLLHLKVLEAARSPVHVFARGLTKTLHLHASAAPSMRICRPWKWRTTGLTVAINLIADPTGMKQFASSRNGLPVCQIVHPPSTPRTQERNLAEARKLTSLDYRLFDVQHAVLPTRLPLKQFNTELVKTQAILNRKHLVSAPCGRE